MPDPAELIPLFSTPVFKARIETHSITPDHINELEYTVYPDGTGKQSKNTKVLLSEPFTQLKIDIDKYLNAFVFDTLKIGQGNLVHVQSWINMHDPGDHAPKHHHINSCYSGVYYIQTPYNSGGIVFTKSPSHMEQIFAHPSEGNLWNSSEWEFPTKAGDLILFPSYLTHSVPKNESKEKRISVAFNYFLEGTLGDHTGQVTLRIQ
jgi:uncharacterized protein (TIGR02466 family)|tara:strand:- start:1007 stop:1624 length:618 start_codon:yes stop_codon:yes gene_type:complete